MSELSQADAAVMRKTIDETIARLNNAVAIDGLNVAIAQAIGMSYAVAMLFKERDMVEVHRQLRKDLAKFVRGGADE